MRTISGKIIQNDYVLNTPFRMLISGSSGTGMFLLCWTLYLYKLYILGKTTFCENLISSNRIDRKFKTIYYIYPYELGEPPVQWDVLFSDICIHYMNELPDLKFWDTVERHSLVIIDDLWLESSNSPDIVKSFKVKKIIYFLFLILRIGV